MFSLVSFTALMAGIVSAMPTAKREMSPDGVYFPLSNGFPNPSTDATMQIQMDAHGTLPNGPPPSSLSPEGTTNLKLIALNEIFEVAYFSELVYNVTNKVQGYDLGYGHEYVLDALKAIVAQEELHALNANGALQKFNQQPIAPCKYNFPVTDFQSAMSLAGTFTDLVLGTLQDVNQLFAKSGDFGLVRAVSSVIGNEGEQEGFFRLVQKKRPSSQPFLTTAVRDFAFTAIQSFTIPGSCPNINTIPLRTFKALTLMSTNIKPATQNLKFSFAKADANTTDYSTLSLVYINGQNNPVVKSLQNANVEGGNVVFEAAFPYDEFVMDGLTIAAVTKGAGPFADADAVAAATQFGPGLIEFD
ncbi:late sexual development protein [Pleomassaria siparia CBS 279.74]|uniref:Late sexual development protein n=1 Tax=Pleomassaria siparia CBS 279.74 TaxID=1314801 RepID=A0A6G1KT00_9PLEO|nr:late sexual development protein [Pleomassaria siparia CBS 279.74]